MTTTDKTRQRLMASMRKTKKKAVSDQAAPAAATRKRSTPTASPPAAKTARATTRGRQAAPADGYQSGRRVWPD